jgi:hypothetical protein
MRYEWEVQQEIERYKKYLPHMNCKQIEETMIKINILKWVLLRMILRIERFK